MTFYPTTKFEFSDHRNIYCYIMSNNCFMTMAQHEKVVPQGMSFLTISESIALKVNSHTYIGSTQFYMHVCMCVCMCAFVCVDM